MHGRNPAQRQTQGSGLYISKQPICDIITLYYLQALLSKYNIGIDPDVRNKGMVEAVAKRVGFKLPQQCKE